jgi:phosphatidylserine/phosphatidylglycerophosphate/cardiolipin synthase-like enzyme
VTKLDSLRALPVAELLTRSPAGVDEATRLIAAADDELVGELFKVTRQDTVDALASRPVHVRAAFLSDPEYLDSAKFANNRALLEESGVELIPHGAMPRKVHAKGIVADGEEGWLSSSTLMYHRDTLDFTARFSGKPARALRDVTRSAITDGVSRQRRLARQAAKQGILLNDRTAGITELTRGVEALIRGANDELVIVTKAFTDKRLARMIVAKAHEGVRVHLATQSEKMWPRVRQILDEGGVQFYDDVFGATHGNAVIADGTVGYFGSAHFTPRAMVRDTGAYRSSRELGAIVRGEHAATIRQEILDVTGSMPASSPTAPLPPPAPPRSRWARWLGGA